MPSPHLIASLLFALSQAQPGVVAPQAGPAVAHGAAEAPAQLTTVGPALDGVPHMPAAVFEAGTGLTRDARGGRTTSRGAAPLTRAAPRRSRPAARAARARASSRNSLHHAPIGARAHLATPATLGNPPPSRTHS